MQMTLATTMAMQLYTDEDAREDEGSDHDDVEVGGGGGEAENLLGVVYDDALKVC